MTCFDTNYAWLSSANADGKTPLIFSPAKAAELGLSPESALTLPCGRCVGCLADKARVWSIRLFHEMQMHDQCSFVTLTYRDPSQSVIDKKHLQDFFKRLRKHYSFRYFACGEYGDATHRPHYHVIFFGQDFLGGSYPLSDDLYSNKILEMIWKHGLVAIGRVTFDSICYVAGYVMKKMADSTDEDLFRLMSRKPGIGKGWLDKYKQELINNGFAIIDGRKMEVPMQYLRWYEFEFQDVKEQRKEKVRKYTRSQLASKRINLNSKLGLKGKKL